jgi:hypothetical protein
MGKVETCTSGYISPHQALKMAPQSTASLFIICFARKNRGQQELPFLRTNTPLKNSEDAVPDWKTAECGLRESPVSLWTVSSSRSTQRVLFFHF